ncbi:MAG: hypothetical protein RL148_1622 [Planctomycetota bacterium]
MNPHHNALRAVGLLLLSMLAASFVMPTGTNGPAAAVVQDPADPMAQWPQVTVDGRKVDWRSFQTRSVMVTFFSTRMSDLVTYLQALQLVYDERKQANLEVVAVCTDNDPAAQVAALLKQHGITVPVVVDAKGVLREGYKPQSMPHSYFFAEQQRYLGDLPGFPEEGYPSRQVFYANLVRRAVGLDVAVEGDPLRNPWPVVPAFSIPGTSVTDQSLRGTTWLLAFVATDCDKCKAQLDWFKSLHRELAGQKVEFHVVVVNEDVDPARFRTERDLPFAVHADRGGAVRRALHYRGFVPDTLVVDTEGRIRFRHTVFDEEQPPLYRMELKHLLGMPNPPLLKATGPSGERRCMVCHEREYFDWLSSGHAHAMRTLQAQGQADNPECVQCHVVGWDKPGGYNANQGARAHLLANVQCESCHGDGGPHLVKDRSTRAITAATCTPCHDEKHSLNFDFDRFRELVSHQSNLLGATPEQQRELAARRDAIRRTLLEPEGSYVGASACKDCHQGQYERWQGSGHARAVQRLTGQQVSDPACARCHHTGLERTWAGRETPKAGDPLAASVQCEACHGPGERHVKAGSAEQYRATILGMGAKCEECVIAQVCTNCHDPKNDPDFDLKKALPPMRALCRPPATK